jgi:protoporphyrinogen oxidase
MSPAQRAYDAIIVGGGLGGLLAAALISRRGGSVLVLERLRYLGGRFTTVVQDGFDITTGALHMAPHGGGGPLARVVRELGLPFEIVPRDVRASFFYRGKHVLWSRPWDVLKLFGAQGQLDLIKITAKLSTPLAQSRTGTQAFSTWLATQSSEPAVHHFFASFIEFAASVRADQISYAEMGAIHRNVLRYGMPGTPVGGCAALIRDLTDVILAHHGDIRTGVEVLRILTDQSSRRVHGIQLRDRHTRDIQSIRSSLVVSDAGPEATRALLGGVTGTALDTVASVPRAAGLKLHIVSDKSLIPHNGVMLCLGMRRVSGMVEVSRAIPSIVPPGLHMLDTFQVMDGNSLIQERDLAVADLRDIFGGDFDRHCRIVRTSAFRGRWPVNQARQGHDLLDREPLPGLVMVGDAYKPAGHIMVEGVAEGVRRVSRRLVRTLPGLHPGAGVTHNSQRRARADHRLRPAA